MSRMSGKSVFILVVTGLLVAAFAALGKCVYDGRPCDLIVAFIVLLLVVILLGGFGMFGRSGFGRLASDLRMFFRPPGIGGGRSRSTPVAVVALALFTVGVTVAWIATTRSYGQFARNVMRIAMNDFTGDFNDAPDSCLYYVGSAITSHYRTPESATRIDVHELMSRYGIDELNVVDRNGIVLCGDLATVGFDFRSNSNTAAFLRLLDGATTYAQKFRAAIEDPSIVRKYVGVAFPDHNGFVQIGFDEKRIARDFDYQLGTLANDWMVGTAGYCVLVRTDGHIVSSGHDDIVRREHPERSESADGRTLASIGFDASLIPPEDADDCFFDASLYGERCLCVSKRLGNYHRLIVAIPKPFLSRSRNSSVTFVALILAVVLGTVAFFGARLANLVARLREFIAEDKRRRSEELRNAKAIQTESLPTVFPDGEAYRIFARMDTAKEVGGDFYDFYTLPSGRQLFLIADTSGKGIPAAMFMMKAKAVIRAGLFEADDFATAVAEANDRLAESNDANMFVTAWIGIFNAATGEIEFVNCGHNPPLVKRADGTVRWVRTRPCLALAAMPRAKYRVEKLTLGRGESLLLYTDGVTEAMNGAGEQYGERRLEADLAAAPCRKFVEELRAKVAEFVAGAEQSDDITMLALDRK